MQVERWTIKLNNMSEIIFYIMLLNGSITPMNETNDDRELYVLCVEECHEYVYREEIIEFIETSTFEYDDFLTTEK